MKNNLTSDQKPKTELHLYKEFFIFIVLPVCAFFFVFHTFLKGTGEFESIQSVIEKQRKDPKVFFSSLDPAKMNKYRLEVIKDSKPDWLFVWTSRARSFLNYLTTEKYSSYTMSSSVGSIFHYRPLLKEVFSVHKPKGVFLVLSEPMFVKEWFNQSVPYAMSSQYKDSLLQELEHTLYQWRQTAFYEYSDLKFFKENLLNRGNDNYIGFLSKVNNPLGASFNYYGLEKNRKGNFKNIFKGDSSKNLNEKYVAALTLVNEGSSYFPLPESGVYNNAVDELKQMLELLNRKEIKTVVFLSLPAPFVHKKILEDPIRSKFFNELIDNLKKLAGKYPNFHFELDSMRYLRDEHYDNDGRHTNLLGGVEVTSQILKSNPKLSEYFRNLESLKYVVEK